MTLREATAHAKAQRLWEDPQWLRLLHYYPSFWTRSFEGQPDGPEFYISPDGKFNSESEMMATLKSFFESKERVFLNQLPQTPRCQFPARFRFFAKHIGLKDSDLPKQDCQAFKEWYARLLPKSATLVFSSYYLNNPSSTFGHSLIRLNKTEHSENTERHQLLDYGINFAATMRSSNPLIYSFDGFAGFAKGLFTSIPYYYKVREYNDFETRDLWEYDLNLTTDEVETLTEHFWELGSTYFDYFYLTENCSFHMITALEAAAPRLNLTDRLHAWVIPADTVKIVYETEGLVKKVHYRPSLWTQFKTRLELLDQEQKEDLDYILGSRETSRSALVLDAAMDFIDYKHGRELLKENKEFLNWKQRLLVTRAKLPSYKPLEVRPRKLTAPHVGHSSLRVGLQHLNSEHLHLWEPSIRFALHDLADPVQGYPSYAKIEFMHLRFRYTEELGQFLLEKMLLFSIDSFSAMETFQKSISWRAEIGFERFKTDFPFFLRGGPGVTWNYIVPPNNPLLTQYLLVEGAAYTSNDFILTPLTGIRFQIEENLIFHGELRLSTLYDFKNSSQSFFREGHARLRYAPDWKFAYELGHRWTPTENLFTAGMYFYF